jgi:fatty-acyl-CoA synthase
MPSLERVFHIDTYTENQDFMKYKSFSHQNSELSYSNKFTEMLVYREPSSTSVRQVEENIIKQDNNKIINIQFTSGTTGKPKAAALTHRNILNNAVFISERMGYSPKDKICLTVPYYHCFGMVMGNLSTLIPGSCIVMPWATFDARRSLEATVKHKCNVMYGVPTMFMEMVKFQQTHNLDLSCLNQSMIAGSLCPEQLLRDKSTYLNISDVRVAYGMTETSPITFMSKLDDPPHKKYTTVGSICPHVEAKIIDSQGNTVPIGEQGEYVAKGYMVMDCYYNDVVNTQKNIVDGWLMTGDLARFDSDGFLYIEGRIKDLIIRGGENISPKEIEEEILKLPQVDNVQVIGVPDPKYQEEICALIKLLPDQSLSKRELLNYLKPLVSHFKIPAYVQFVDSFPITVTGKPQKNVMKDNWNSLIKDLSQKDVLELYGLKHLK